MDQYAAYAGRRSSLLKGRRSSTQGGSHKDSAAMGGDIFDPGMPVVKEGFSNKYQRSYWVNSASKQSGWSAEEVAPTDGREYTIVYLSGKSQVVISDPDTQGLKQETRPAGFLGSIADPVDHVARASIAPPASRSSQPTSGESNWEAQTDASTADVKSDWIQKTDPKSGATYYFNTKTKDSTWYEPPDFGHSIVSTSTGDHAVGKSKPKVEKEEWTEKLDPSSGRKYYVHQKTRQSVWQKPTTVKSDDVDIEDDGHWGRGRAQTTHASSPEESTADVRSDWIQKTDPKSGHTYYYNTKKRQSSWEMPDILKEAEITRIKSAATAAAIGSTSSSDSTSSTSSTHRAMGFLGSIADGKRKLTNHVARASMAPAQARRQGPAAEDSGGLHTQLASQLKTIEQQELELQDLKAQFTQLQRDKVAEEETRRAGVGDLDLMYREGETVLVGGRRQTAVVLQAYQKVAQSGKVGYYYDLAYEDGTKATGVAIDEVTKKEEKTNGTYIDRQLQYKRKSIMLKTQQLQAQHNNAQALAAQMVQEQEDEAGAEVVETAAGAEVGGEMERNRGVITATSRHSIASSTPSLNHRSEVPPPPPQPSAQVGRRPSVRDLEDMHVKNLKNGARIKEGDTYMKRVIRRWQVQQLAMAWTTWASASKGQNSDPCSMSPEQRLRLEVEAQVRREYEERLGIQLPAGSLRDAAAAAAEARAAATIGLGDDSLSPTFSDFPFERIQYGSIASRWDQEKREQRFAQLEELDGFMATQKKEVLARLKAHMPVMTQVLRFWHNQRVRGAWDRWEESLVVARNEELLLQAEREEDRALQEAEELAVAARLRAEHEAVMFRRQADELAMLAQEQAQDELESSRRAAAEAVSRANAAKQRLLASMN